MVGRDFALDDRRMLASQGIDLEGLTVDESGDTFRWGGTYARSLNERTTNFTHLNVFERIPA